jgi:putative two-component system response regulator
MLQSPQFVTGAILVADDQPANRELLEELLSAEGFAVTTVPDGAAALEAVHAVPPDLVLSDVMMPRVNGFEVCAQLKSNPETYLIPVVLVTALSDKQDRLAGIKAGADDFLTRPVDRLELLARVRSLIRLKQHTDELERAESVLFSLAHSIEAKDPYTGGHCERLSTLGSALGERMSLTEAQVVALRRAGIVHDIGKVAVPDSVLLKPGRLTPEERKIMQEHPVVGERICRPLKSFHLVLPIIRHHHEKMDGTGYPDRIRGEEIEITARVLQIVDVYDALTTERPYKRALSTAEAMQTMKEEVAKGWWDGRVFGEFERMIQTDAAGLLAKSAAAK